MPDPIRPAKREFRRCETVANGAKPWSKPDPNALNPGSAQEK